MNDYEKYFKTYAGTPRGKKSSVHYNRNNLRFIKAEEQAKLNPVSIERIIALVNELLKSQKMKQIKCPFLQLNPPFDPKNICYERIPEYKELKDKKDIVWMKFTKQKYLVVVAISKDINFDIPESSEVYDVKKGKDRWRYNTSGIIIHHLNMEWDESFVLVFPLINIPSGKTRKDIEMAIGNYLIDKGVPILDFYSHNY